MLVGKGLSHAYSKEANRKYPYLPSLAKKRNLLPHKQTECNVLSASISAMISYSTDISKAIAIGTFRKLNKVKLKYLEHSTTLL